MIDFYSSFFDEIDIERVVKGSLWNFCQRTLCFKVFEEEDDLACVNLL